MSPFVVDTAQGVERVFDIANSMRLVGAVSSDKLLFLQVSYKSITAGAHFVYIEKCIL